MQRCIIHFGMHKTGSTSIQHTLADALESSKFYYMNLGDSPHKSKNHSQELSIAFQSTPFKTKVAQISGLNSKEILEKRTKIQNLITNQLTKKSVENFIFSAEALRNWSKKDVQNFKNFLNLTIQSFIIVGYIRPPKSFIESAFQEKLKGGAIKLDLHRIYPHYKRKFEKFGTVFGWDNVLFWLFDSKNFPEGCVVQDFCNRLSIPIQKESIIRSNESLSKEAISLLYAYRIHGPGYGISELVMKDRKKNTLKETKKLITYLSNLKGCKFRFSSNLIKPILTLYQEDIAWMEEKLGKPLAEDLAKDDEIAINAEQDLLKFSPKATYWLAEQLGEQYVQSWHECMSAEQVAEWMHLLRLKISNCKQN